MPTSEETARGLREQLEKLLEKIESGELGAPKATKHRIEGGIVVLSVVIGDLTRGEMEDRLM